MSSTMMEQAVVAIAPPREPGFWADRTSSVGRYLRRNPTLIVGLSLLLALLLFVVIGSFLVDVQRARPLSARALQPPGGTLAFGSDMQRRDLFALWGARPSQ